MFTITMGNERKDGIISLACVCRAGVCVRVYNVYIYYIYVSIISMPRDKE